MRPVPPYDPAAVDEAVFRLFAEIVREHAIDTVAPQMVATVDSYLRRPAKRLRPKLLMSAARAFGATDGGAVLRLAAATELLHLFALIHDDLIDQNPRAAASSSAVRVLSGDLLFVLGYRGIVSAVAKAGLPVGIVDVVDRAAITTLSGQAMELNFAEDPDWPPSFQRLCDLYDRKTGWYTFVAPLQIGALCGSSGPDDRDVLEAAGRKLGHAFQLRDDAADIASVLGQDEEATLGGGLGLAVPPWEFNLAAVVANETGVPTDQLTVGDIQAYAGQHSKQARDEAIRLLAGLSIDAERVAELSRDACGSVDDHPRASVS